MSPICRSKWDFSYWLPWKLSRLSANRVMCILHLHQPLPIAGMSELGQDWQICHWCMRLGKIQLLLVWQCWPGLSINEEQMQFAKHIELIRGYNKAGLKQLFKEQALLKRGQSRFQDWNRTVFLKACSVCHLYHNHLELIEKYVSGSNPRPVELECLGVGHGKSPHLTSPWMILVHIKV